MRDKPGITPELPDIVHSFVQNRIDFYSAMKKLVGLLIKQRIWSEFRGLKKLQIFLLQ
jgi:hypothetical protein